MFGHSSSVPFFRKTLEKYGAKVHVYKHGAFKNAPNSFTETGFTKEHKKNIETYLFALDNFMCGDIASARQGLRLSPDMWKLIQNSGSFGANTAKKMGFVDYTPVRTPLDALLASRKAKAKTGDLQELKAAWSDKTDFENFRAQECVTLSAYRKIVDKRRKLEQSKWHAYTRLKSAAEKHSIIRNALAAVGYKEPFFNFAEVKRPTFSFPVIDWIIER